jgi:hypothetical protein
MEPNKLKQIFFDEHGHWDAFVKKHGKHIREIVLKEVEKFRGCGDPKNGFKLLVCEGCHDMRRVPFRCKGRFCSTCSSAKQKNGADYLRRMYFKWPIGMLSLRLTRGYGKYSYGTDTC